MRPEPIIMDISTYNASHRITLTHACIGERLRFVPHSSLDIFKLTVILDTGSPA